MRRGGLSLSLSGLNLFLLFSLIPLIDHSYFVFVSAPRPTSTTSIVFDRTTNYLLWFRRKKRGCEVDDCHVLKKKLLIQTNSIITMVYWTRIPVRFILEISAGGHT